MNTKKQIKIANRGQLKRLIEKGMIEIRTDMILTDDYAFDASTNCQKSEEWKPAKIEDFSIYDFSWQGGKITPKASGNEYFWKLCTNNYYSVRIKA